MELSVEEYQLHSQAIRECLNAMELNIKFHINNPQVTKKYKALHAAAGPIEALLQMKPIPELDEDRQTLLNRLGNVECSLNGVPCDSFLISQISEAVILLEEKTEAFKTKPSTVPILKKEVSEVRNQIN